MAQREVQSLMGGDPVKPEGVAQPTEGARTDREGHSQETEWDSVPAVEQTPARKPGVVAVRCPHCHNSFAHLNSESLSDITCPACGSHFSLIGPEETLPYAPIGPPTIAGFELLERVGVGQYGTVWKARDLRLDRVVAVKIPRRGQLDDAEIEQFLREARAAAQVRHSGVVSVHEVGREGNTLYIVSDYVEGVTLTEWLTAQRFTAQEAARLCIRLAEALDAAHQVGVVHRDLKPGNIMMDLAGDPHIADFGLAKRDTGDVTMTLDGQILGTPAYMSPEQARGEGHRADRRSDVYSLGVVLYELLTGERPFRGDPHMLVLQVVRDEPPSPRRLNGRIPGDLEAICLKCLEKDPGRRYQTAQELSEDLSRFLAGQPVIARPAGPLGRAWRWYRNHPEAAVWTAGGYAACSSIFLLCWNLAGIVVLSLGIHRSEDVGSAMALLGAIAVGVYLPILWAGLQTLRGGLIGLCVNALLAMIGVAFCVLGLAGHMFADEAIWGNRMTRLPLFTLLIAIALVGLVLHVIALVSRRAEKS